ncbi:MAG: hypothetical protein M0006_08510 [Magnetospirillum sp.]|nr:hypothetical protein [Magnetospirillum sp.]
MEHDRAAADKAAPSAETAAIELMQVMAELRAVFLAENDLLRRGLPAKLVEMVDRKTELSEEFSSLYRDVFVQHADDLAANPELRERLVETGHELQDLSRENMWRLEAALNATRRRVEAVMAAIRAHDSQPRTCGDGGVAVGQAADGTLTLRA